MKRLDNTNSYERNIIYVGNLGCLAGATPDGSQAKPYCEITQALQRNLLDNRSYIIRVFGKGSPYDGRILRSDVKSPIQIIGPDVDERKKGPVDEVMLSSPVTLDGQILTRLFVARLDGVRILNDAPGDNIYGLSCIGPQVSSTTLVKPRLELRRVVISPSVIQQGSSGGALVISGCDFNMDRTAILDNSGNALIVDTSTTEYQITNSIIANNGLNSKTPRPAITLNGKGIFRFNTVVNNGGATIAIAGGLKCAATETKIENSIFFQNKSPQLASEGICKLVGTLWDNPNFSQSFPTSMFDGRFDTDWLKLTVGSPALDSAEPVATVGAGALSYWKWDYAGNRRPLGIMYDKGAMELKR